MSYSRLFQIAQSCAGSAGMQAANLWSNKILYLNKGCQLTQVNLYNVRTYTYTRLLALCPSQVSRYQKGKTSLDFTEARDSEWQWQ